MGRSPKRNWVCSHNLKYLHFPSQSRRIFFFLWYLWGEHNSNPWVKLTKAYGSPFGWVLLEYLLSELSRCASRNSSITVRFSYPGIDSCVSFHFWISALIRHEVKWSVSLSVVSDSLRSHGLYPARLLSPWDSPGKNTGMSSHSFIQGIFPTKGLNPGLLHCRQILNHLSHYGSLNSPGSLITSLGAAACLLSSDL